MVEMTPTYKRSKELLNSIKEKAVGAGIIEPESAFDSGAVISFT